jgi:hypothetical protein
MDNGAWIMKMHRFLSQTLIAVSFLTVSSAPSFADGFSISFEWGSTPDCSSGQPDNIKSPAFGLSSVPNGTKKIRFDIVDFQSSYDHGGGSAAYSGQKMIKPGAFWYEGPCPPDGSHTYQWTAKALDGNDEVLAKASAQRQFPE